MNETVDRAWWDRTANIAFIAFALGLAWGLKDFYSHARFEDLKWVLAPTRRLVEWMSGATFEAEAHRGYLSRDRLFEIVPACAGVNFMIVAFASLACGLAHTRSTIAGKLTLLASSGLVAYGVTVLANAVRISLAMRLHDAHVSFGFVTADQLHSAVGAATYFFFLLAVFAIGAKVTGARRDFAF